MTSPSLTNLQAAALPVVHATKAKSADTVTDVDVEEGWQVVVPRSRSKKTTTSALPEPPAAQVDTISSQRGRGATIGGNIAGKNIAGGRGKDSRGERGARGASGRKGNNHSTAVGNSGREKKRTPAAPSQALTSTKSTVGSLTFRQVVAAATPVEPQESSLDETNGNHEDSAQLKFAAAAPVEPQQSTLDENNGKHEDLAQLVLAADVPAHPSIQLDSQTGVFGSQASFSDKEVVDLSSPAVSLLQSRSALLDDDVSQKTVLVAVAAVPTELDVKSMEGTVREAIVPVEAASEEHEDHKNEATRSSIPSSAEAGRKELMIIEISEEPSPFSSETLLQPRSSEITNIGSSVPVECVLSSAEAGRKEHTIIEISEEPSLRLSSETLLQPLSSAFTGIGSSVPENLDYAGLARSTVDEPKSAFTARNNASEGGTEGMDVAKGRLSVAIPPFQSNHGAVPFKAVALVPAVNTWAVTVTPFMHGTSLHPQFHAFPHVEEEPIYQAATPMITMVRTQTKLNPYAREFLPSYTKDKLNPYAREFLPSYIKDQSSTFGIMVTQHCRLTSTESAAAVPLSSRGGQRVDTTQSASGAGNDDNNNGGDDEVEVGQTQGRHRRHRRRNRHRGRRGEGPIASNRSLGDFFHSSY